MRIVRNYGKFYDRPGDKYIIDFTDVTPAPSGHPDYRGETWESVDLIHWSKVRAVGGEPFGTEADCLALTQNYWDNRPELAQARAANPNRE